MLLTAGNNNLLCSADIRAGAEDFALEWLLSQVYAAQADIAAAQNG